MTPHDHPRDHSHYLIYHFILFAHLSCQPYLLSPDTEVYVLFISLLYLNWPRSGSRTFRTRFGPEPDPRFGVHVRADAEPEHY